MQFWLEPRTGPKKHFGFPVLVVTLSILALTISLANRTFEGSFDTSPTAHSASSKAKIQHRDKDATKWVAPIAVFAWLRRTRISIVQPEEHRPLAAVLYASLYNRPPPIL